MQVLERALAAAPPRRHASRLAPPAQLPGAQAAPWAGLSGQERTDRTRSDQPGGQRGGAAAAGCGRACSLSSAGDGSSDKGGATSSGSDESEEDGWSEEGEEPRRSKRARRPSVRQRSPLLRTRGRSADRHGLVSSGRHVQQGKHAQGDRRQLGQKPGGQQRLQMHAAGAKVESAACMVSGVQRLHVIFGLMADMQPLAVGLLLGEACLTQVIHILLLWCLLHELSHNQDGCEHGFFRVHAVACNGPMHT